MALFTPYPHSPEISSTVTPEIRRDQQVIPLALGYLSASVEAMQSIEVTPLVETTRRPYSAQDWYAQHPQPENGDITALQEYYRKKAEIAHMTHDDRYPAEDITPEVSDFRAYAQSVSATSKVSPEQPIAPVITFPERVFDANPNLNKNIRRAA